MKSDTPKKRSMLKSSTKNQAKGKARELKGKVKETAGRIRNDPDMEAEGTVDRVKGTVQKRLDRSERSLASSA